MGNDGLGEIMSTIENTPIMPPLTGGEVEVRDVLRRHVEKLAGEIGIRHDSQPASLDATVAYLQTVWQRLEQSVVIEPYTTAVWEAKNLVVEWPGTTQPDKIVIVGAHYDTVRSTPGADDNASAVAMMLAICEALRGRTFDFTLRFVAFANEEPPHFVGSTMGSRVYAKGCKSRGEDIYAMVCLEMVGFYNTTENSQTYPEELPESLAALASAKGDFIAFVSDISTSDQLEIFTDSFHSTVSFPAISVPLPNASHVMWVSDHGPFWDEGYPALMVTDTSWFRNPNYHEMSDLPDTLDYDRMARVAVGVTEGVAKLAGTR